MLLTVNQVKSLMRQYDSTSTIDDIMRMTLHRTPHECPKCAGSGKMEILIPYPPNLPDSGWVDPTKSMVECDLCHGGGYTQKEYKKVVTQVKYEYQH